MRTEIENLLVRRPQRCAPGHGAWAPAGPEAAWAGAASEDVVCDALILSLSVLRLHLEWHAGVLDADGAMAALDEALDDVSARRRRRRLGRALPH